MHLKTDSGANSHYAKVPTISRSRNAFSIAEKHVTTCQFDYLFPVYHKFIYPGDTLAGQHASLARLTTQIATLFDDLYFDVHAWFVPLRIIQTDWARFQFNSQPLGPTQDNSSLTTPSIDLSGLTSGFASKSLYDYFGYPTLVNCAASGQHINNYLGRAYNLIWNLNYRDQNLQAAATVDLGQGPDDPSNYVLRKRGKRHDKFTSALTAQQKGTAVSLPLGTSAPVLSNGQAIRFNEYGNPSNYATLELQGSPNRLNLGSPSGGSIPVGSDLVFNSTYTGLYTDLMLATAANINQFRTSVVIQQLLEADARGGTRDVESVAHRWGVQIPDFRLQQPEYLGGATWTFDGHVVPQTSESGTTPQGTLTQFSQALNTFNINHSFVEHGVFMILLSARSNITYQQGLARELSHKTRYDFYQPEFANIGEVAVPNKEIYFQGTSYDDLTFGFQEYAYWLRYGENRVSAEMRSNYPTSRDYQHMADDYSSLPTLSSGWIESNTPISRNIAVSSSVADPIQLNLFFKGTIARTLPMYSVPGLTRI